MTKPQNSGVARLSRRQAIARVAGAGLGIASALRMAGDEGLVNAAGQAKPSVAPDGEYRWPSHTNAKLPSVPSWKTELIQLVPGKVYAYTQRGGQGMDNAGISNAGVIVGPDHMMAFDSLVAPIHTRAFLAAVAKATGGRKFDRLVNSHHHGDHTNGNGFFASGDIVSHPYCRQMVIKQGLANLNNRPLQWQFYTDELKVAPPVTTFEDKLTFYYGDLDVHLMSVAPAHTYGDVMVHLPQNRILFAGDVAFFYVHPVSAGHTSHWIEVLDQINKMDVDTIVPGHGPVGTKKDLAELSAYLQLLKREARRRYDAKMSPGKAAVDIDLGKFENWANRERIVGTIVRLYAEFDGKIAADLDPAVATKANEEWRAVHPPEPR